MYTVKKSPESVIDFTFDYNGDYPGPYLESGEEIVDSTWTAEPGITIASSSYDATTTTVWLSGGTKDTDYVVTNTIETSLGRTDSRRMTVQVREI